MTPNDTKSDGTERDAAIACPTCGKGATQVKPEQKNEEAVDFSVADSGEIVSAKTVTLLEYTFQPCGHTALGTQDRGYGRSLHTGMERDDTADTEGN